MTGNKKQIVLGVSGGVDSAAAAALLMREGYAVTAVWLDTGCGSPDGARSVASQLGIPLVTVDARAMMERNVIGPFAREYCAGRTPNPCVVCNPAVKFRLLFEAASGIAPDCLVATGHYVRLTEYRGRTALSMYRGAKDQSYMLCRLPAQWLPRLRFPLAGAGSKEEIRAFAAGIGLEAANAPDSQDICFIPDGDHAAFLERRGVRMPEGDFVSPDGKVLGKHGGVHRYTVGQRRGLGVAAGERIYVTGIDADRSRVVLGPEAALMCRRFLVSDPVWQQETCLPEPLACRVRIRYRAAPADCTVTLLPDGMLEVVTDIPVRAPAPGQTAAFYDGDVLLGGGFLEPGRG